MIPTRGVFLLGLTLALYGCAHLKSLAPEEALTPRERQQAIGRAAVWSPTLIPSVDFKAGPEVSGAFAPNAWVNCEYKEKDLSGPRNAEVFGEVLATRLLWALGFPVGPRSAP